MRAHSRAQQAFVFLKTEQLDFLHCSWLIDISADRYLNSPSQVLFPGKDLEDLEMRKVPALFSTPQPKSHEKFSLGPYTVGRRFQAAALGIYWLGITFLIKLFVVVHTTSIVSLRCLIIAALIILSQWTVTSQLFALVIKLCTEYIRPYFRTYSASLTIYKEAQGEVQQLNSPRHAPRSLSTIRDLCSHSLTRAYTTLLQLSDLNTSADREGEPILSQGQSGLLPVLHHLM